MVRNFTLRRFEGISSFPIVAHIRQPISAHLGPPEPISCLIDKARSDHMYQRSPIIESFAANRTTTSTMTLEMKLSTLPTPSPTPLPAEQRQQDKEDEEEEEEAGGQVLVLTRSANAILLSIIP